MRLGVGLAAAGLLPVAFASYRLIDLNRHAITDQVQRTHSLATRSVSDGVWNLLANQLSLAAGLASHPALAEPRSDEARGLLRRSLQGWTALGVLAVAVVDRQGEQVILAQVTDPEEKRRIRIAFDQPRDRAVVGYAAEPAPLIRVRSPLPGEAGYIWLLSDGGGLRDAMDAYELGEEAELALVDDRGQALLGSAAGFSPRLLALARDRKIQGVDPAFREGPEGEEFIGAFAPVPEAGWTVLSRQPTSVAYAVTRRMRRQALLAVAFTVLLGATLSALAWVSVVRPIRELILAQRRLAGLGPAAREGDEIDQLRSSFEALRQRLKEREALDQVFLGRYQVLDVIGSGAMGTVFLGQDPKLERPVALKTIRLDKTLPPERRRELIERLLREAVTVAKFNHPNIVAVYDVEDHAEAAFVAMEYVEGVSLETLLWRVGKLGYDQTVPVGAALARGLAAAHARGLVHRDVKPANILLGSDGAIKITDFGIAELLSSMAEGEDVVFGTPGYLPPETLQGKGYDASGDLFALGAILYFCLVGVRAFEGRSVREVVRKTLFGPLGPPSRLDPSIPPDLETLILRLMAAQREERLCDAAEVSATLEQMTFEGKLSWKPPVESMGAQAEGQTRSGAGRRRWSSGGGGFHSDTIALSRGLR